MLKINSITLRTYAKINLSLSIIGKRNDGFHEIDTVMQSVSLSDTIRLERIQKPGVSLSGGIPGLVSDKNLAYRAARSFFHNLGINGGVTITLDKQIPVAAGLAGGSSDAAAVLNGLCRMYGIEPDNSRVFEIALSLGADVPFCLGGGTQRARGIGEKLSPLPSLPPCWLVIAKNSQKSSTASLYAQYDQCKTKKPLKTDGMIAALNTGDIRLCAAHASNAFEDVADGDVRLLKKAILESGALGTCLSGSGPTVYGIFPDQLSAEKCEKRLADSGSLVQIAQPVHAGFEILASN